MSKPGKQYARFIAFVNFISIPGILWLHLLNGLELSHTVLYASIIAFLLMGCFAGAFATADPKPKPGSGSPKLPKNIVVQAFDPRSLREIRANLEKQFGKDGAEWPFADGMYDYYMRQIIFYVYLHVKESEE